MRDNSFYTERVRDVDEGSRFSRDVPCGRAAFRIDTLREILPEVSEAERDKFEFRGERARDNNIHRRCEQPSEPADGRRSGGALRACDKPDHGHYQYARP